MTNDKNGKEVREKTEGNPTECAGEGKYSKGNIEEEKRIAGVAKHTFVMNSWKEGVSGMEELPHEGVLSSCS